MFLSQSNFLVVGIIGLWISFSPCSTGAEINSKIASFGACKDDVSRLCGNQPLPNDLAVLDCLQDRRSESDNDLNPDCHSVLHRYSMCYFYYH